jgi:hypothetical protein
MVLAGAGAGAGAKSRQVLSALRDEENRVRHSAEQQRHREDGEHTSPQRL